MYLFEIATGKGLNPVCDCVGRAMLKRWSISATFFTIPPKTKKPRRMSSRFEGVELRD
jgi:hypothetical protein